MADKETSNDGSKKKEKYEKPELRDLVNNTSRGSCNNGNSDNTSCLTGGSATGGGCVGGGGN